MHFQPTELYSFFRFLAPRLYGSKANLNEKMRKVNQTENIFKLETELKTVKTAFEDYIASSKELEDGFDKELSEMRKFK